MRTWIEIELIVPAAATELAGAELAELGCEGVTVEEQILDTFIPPDPHAETAAEYALRAYFPAPEQPELLLAEITSRLAWLGDLFPGWTPQALRWRPVRNEDWAEGWKQHFPVTPIGRHLVVKPSWETYAPASGEVVIELDPGMAFGTGTHGTTRLCLEAIDALYAAGRPLRTVLDVGTGSGILAIAAAALGAEQVVACDIDPEACRIAAENAARNNVSARIEITGALLEEIAGQYDLVLANILAEENIRLAGPLVERVAPGGTLVLSGILSEKEQLVAQAFAAYPLGPVTITRRDDWSCLSYQRC